MGIFGKKKEVFESHTNMHDTAMNIMATAEAQKVGLLKSQRGVKEGWVTETEMGMVVVVGHIIGGDDDEVVTKVINQLSLEITKTKFKTGEIKKEDVIKTLLEKLGIEIKVKA